jgi:hypothetical protein
MLKTFRAILEQDGRLNLPKRMQLSSVRKVLVTFLDDEPEISESQYSSFLSESSLGADWNRPEEDEAWQHLQ